MSTRLRSLSGAWSTFPFTLLHVRPGSPKEEPVGTTSARFLQAGCPSCHPTNRVNAHEEYITCKLSLHVLTAIFPGEPWLAGTRMSPFWILLDLRKMEMVNGDN